MIIAETHCSGMGAPEIAMPHWKWALGSEIEPFPRAVCAARHHHQFLWGDLTALRMRHYRLLGFPLPEVIVAGTPCQAFSVAGLRKGLDDDRGNVTLAFARHVLAVDNAARFSGKPRPVLIWENVPGILSHEHNPFGCFLGALIGADDALCPPKGESWPRAGMVSGPRSRLAWRIFDAQYFGVPQRRARVFVVADFGERADPAAILFEPRRVPGDFETGREARQDIAGTLGAGAGGRGGFAGADENDAQANGLIPQLSHALKAEGFDASEDGTGRGTPLIPQLAYALQERDAKGPDSDTKEGHLIPVYAIQERAVSENPNAGPDGVGVREDGLAYTLEARQRAQAICFDETQITSAENRSQPQPGAPSHAIPAQGRPPTIAFSSKDHGADASIEITPTLRAMTHDKSHPNVGGQIAVSYGIRSDAVRDGVALTPSIDSKGRARLRHPGMGVHEELAPTLDSSAPHAVAMNLRGRDGGAMPEADDLASLRAADGGSSRSYVAVSEAWAVRRLTPVECERLQGAPDNFTRIAWRGRAPEDCPDGPRYRVLGNSKAVPVIRWILERVEKALA